MKAFIAKIESATHTPLSGSLCNTPNRDSTCAIITGNLPIILPPTKINIFVTYFALE